MDKQDIIRRLVFIKYLYNLGSEQSQKQEPYCWASISTFHDAVELFLFLTAESLDIPDRTLQELQFTRYWGIINPKLKERGKKELTHRISMDKLNGIRVEFKHHGTEPHLDAINSAKVNVSDFLDENIENVFDIKFSQISLVDLVALEEARTNLKEAMKLKNVDTESAIDRIAIAFNQIVDDFVDRKRDSYGNSMFDFAGFRWYSNWYKIKDELSDIRDALRDLERSVGFLNEITKLVVLGFDIRKYIRFQVLTAREIERTGKEYAIRPIERKVEGSITDEDIQFCIDFVVECAIILKESDFKFTPKKHKTIADLF